MVEGAFVAGSPQDGGEVSWPHCIESETLGGWPHAKRAKRMQSPCRNCKNVNHCDNIHFTNRFLVTHRNFYLPEGGDDKWTEK